MQATNRVLIVLAAVVTLSVGCQSLTQLQSLLNQTGLTGQTGTSEVPATVGAAIAALFSGGPNNSGQQVPETNVDGVCQEFDQTNPAEGPEGINTSATVQAGTYGPTGYSVTLDGSEDCESDDSNPLGYASFEIMEEVSADCSDGGMVSLMPGSTGVYRKNSAQGYNPEIYGTFVVKESDGTTYEGVKCQILLGEDGEVLAANCEDADGNTIATDSNEVTCQF